jgi:hypothetical protein
MATEDFPQAVETAMLREFPGRAAATRAFHDEAKRLR